ncbi:3-ketodihydrosphingosine reductase [Anastrepha ludens]|uniref:3-ketodihydrosphingosine reductase n=1 Tax=Anastrepha ludens TaxID=28586 RepID=UPI0023B09554|nr:3-ketodihydrosphingosine reductase [Anastrepha ludens]XP_053948026.1 3-ketodihydrosphingosine reductase [Anastrepha ludens]XP_053948033.1 3-ketodihydrosphingosine reductase [Anastrepha ludens]
MNKRAKRLVGRHVVVTGGSRGIGLCLAVECAMKGANVTVIARNEKLLSGAVALMDVIRQVPDQKFQYRCLDISTNYDEVACALSEVEKTLGDIYMLVNCAGMAICGVYEDVSEADARKLMDINYWGSYNCTRYVLPKMKAAREGIIVFTSSLAALFGIYGYGPYTASKYAVRGMAETIAMETRHLGILVTLALPADTDTPGFENEEKTKPKETKIISGGGGLAEPQQVAKRILHDALRGNFISILGVESWCLTLLGGGLFRWGGFFQNILHALLLGPLRIIGCFLHLHFERIIKNCAKEKKE